MGRHTKFNDEIPEKIKVLFAQGKTEAQVADILGISERTMLNWKNRFPEFLRALKESKDIADDLVEAALFSRATGYTHTEEKVFCNKDGIYTHKVQKHYAPDVLAAIFWLKNRRPDKWREKGLDEPPDVPMRDITPPPKKSFSEFCEAAAYPTPYPKQIEMYEFGMHAGEPRLLLGARGYGKTDYVTVMGVAYDVYVEGVEASNLIITKSKSRNTAIIYEIAEALKKNGVELEKVNASCIRIVGRLGKDHSVEVLTIKSSFRGRHPKRTIMDDPVTEEDTSEAMRVLVKKKYDEAYKLCKNIVIIGQPAHAYDLYADLRPSLKKLEVPHGSIPELDADLEAMKLAGVDSNSIEMSYHLRIPKSGAGAFDNIKYLDIFPQGDSVAFIDPSDGGDFTAVSVLRAHMDGVAVEGKAWKRAWYHCIEEMVPWLIARRVRRICFETNCTGTQPIEQLQALPALAGIGIVGKHSITTKFSVITAAGSYAHMIHLSKASDRVYTDQVVKWESKSKHDDAPDSLARGLEWLGLIKGK